MAKLDNWYQQATVGDVDKPEIQTEPQSKLEQFMLDDASTQSSALESSMRIGQGSDPERQARVIKQQMRTGLAPDLIERNLEDIELASSDSDFDAESFRKSSPIVADWLSDPENAKLAFDDVGTLTGLEWLFQAPAKAFKEGSDQTQLAQLRFKQLGEGLSDEELKLVEDLKSRKRIDYGVESWLEGALVETAKQLPNMLESVKGGLELAIPASLAAGGTALAAGQMGPQVALPEEFVTVPAATTTGAAIGFRTGALKTSFELETGFAYDEFLDFKDINGQPLDDDVAKTASLVAGGINAGVELLQLDVLIKSFPGIKKYLSKGGTQLVKDALKNPTTVDALKKFSQKYGTVVSVETLTEIGQELVTMVAGEAAKMYQGEFEDADFAQMGDRILETADAALKASVLLAAPGPTAGFVYDYAKTKKANQNKAVMQSLGEITENSKVNQRVPEKLREVVKNIKEQGTVQDVMIPVEQWDTLFQSQGLEPGAVAAEVMGDEGAHYAEARATGADMVIPLEVYTEKLAGSQYHAQLLDDVRFHPEEMTSREARQWEEANAGIIEEAMQNVASNIVQDDGTQFIFDDVVGQLVGTGMERGTAESNAMQMQAAFRTLSSRTGIPANDLWDRYGPTIKREMPEALKKKDFDVSLDPFIDRVRSGDIPGESDVYGPTLLDTLRERGIVDEGGELAARDIDVGLKPFQRKIIRDEGLTVDDAAQQMAAAGYLDAGVDTVTQNDLFEAIDRELSGDPVYSIQNQNAQLAEERASLLELSDYLDTLQVDLEQLTNAQVRSLLLEQVTGEQVADNALYQATAEDKAISEALYNESGVESFIVDGQFDFDAYQRADDYLRDESDISDELYNYRYEGEWINSVTAPLSEQDRNQLINIVNGQTVYHGSPDPDLDVIGFESAADSKFVSFDIESAENYAGDEGKVYEETLSVKNPLFVTSTDVTMDIDENPQTLEEIKALGYDSIIPVDLGDVVLFKPDDVLYQFAGPQAETANLTELGRAQEMLKAGRSPEMTRRETGWFKGPDGKWRFEISDDQASLRFKPEQGGYALGEILEHENLFAAYPDLKYMGVKFISDEEMSETQSPSTMGYFDPKDDTLALRVTMDEESLLSTLLHEIQHGIQEREGFARGGSDESQFTDFVKARLRFISQSMQEDIEQWKWVNNLKITDAEEAARAAQDGLIYKSVQALREHSRRDQPTRVLRLIRGELGWLYAERFQQNDELRREAQELDRRWYDFPKPHKKAERQKFLRELSWDVANFLEKTIKEENLQSFKDDERTLKGMINALERDARKARAELEPLRALERQAQITEKSFEKAKFKSSFQIYQALAGEAEARNTQARQALTEEERQQRSPESTMDIKPEEVIVRFNGRDIRAPMPANADYILYQDQEYITDIEQLDASEDAKFLADELLDNGAQITTDGRVRLYHRTSKEAADKIKQTGKMTSKEDGLFFSTSMTGEAEGFGDSVVEFLVPVERLELDDIFGDEAHVRIPTKRAGIETNVSDILSDKVLEQEKRGQIRISPEKDFEITFFDKADLSTMLHESGHLYLEVIQDLESRGELSESMAEDLATIREWVGAKPGEAMSRDQHEQFARGFEAYLREGKAPTAELQTAFAKFRAWLVSIYRQISRLNVQVTDEVKEVFDRLLATDEEIKAAEQMQEYTRLFESAEEAQMTEAEFAKYQETAMQARDDAQASVAKKQITTMEREQKKWWNQAREEMQAEVMEEIAMSPTYQALSYLQRGELVDGPLPEDVQHTKIDKQSLVDAYGKDFLKRLPKPYIYSVEGGIHQDDIAAMFGFNSGDEMIQAIMVAPKQKDFVKAEVDRRMRDNYGDIQTDGTLPQEAMEAVHNNKRGEVLTMELRALARKSRNPAKPSPASIMKQAAEASVSRKLVRNINAGVYLRAERKAAKEAVELAAQGDFDGALAAKQRQLLNFYLGNAARKAKEETEKAREYLNGFNKNKRREQLGKAGQDYLDQIDSLLEKAEFRRVSLKSLDRRASLDSWIKDQEEQGFSVDVPQELINQTQVVNWKDMTVESLLGLRDSVKNIDHLARFKNKLLASAEKRAFNEVVDDVVSSIEANNKITPILPNFAPTFKDRLKEGLSGYAAWHTKMEFLFEMLDGNKAGGSAWTALFKPLADAEIAEQQMNEKFTAKLRDILNVYTSKERGQWSVQKVHIPGVGTINKETALSVALNWGNAGNRQALLDSSAYNWSELQVQQILELLDERDWNTVQNIWDMINELWPDIAQLQKDLTGLAPDKVESMPVQTQFGEFRGGYYPLVYDTKLSQKAFIRDEKNASKDLFENNFAKPATRKGHTIERVGSAGQSVKLSLDVIGQHMNQAIHDLTHRRAIIDVDRLINNTKVREAIEGAAGQEMYRQVRPWLQSIANERQELFSNYEKVLAHIRTGATIVNMGVKFTTAFAQPLGFLQTVDEIGSQYALRGLTDFFGNPTEMQAKLEFVMSRSTMMRNRQKTFDRDVRDSLNRLNKENKLDRMQESYFYMTGLFDMAVSVPSWLGAYRKAMDGNVENIEKGNEQKAIDYADRSVRVSQSAGGTKDLARIQRGSQTFRLFTMFYSYFSVLYNLMQTRYKQFKTGQATIPQTAASFIFLVAAPAVLGELAASRGPGEDEDYATWAGKHMAMYPFQTIVGVRDVVNALGPFGYSASPAFDAFEKTAKAAQIPFKAGMGEEIKRSDMKAAVLSVSYWGKLPGRQMWITGEYIYDVSTGDEDPESVWEFTHNLMFARPANER